jgi:hypothetical protein
MFLRKRSKFRNSKVVPKGMQSQNLRSEAVKVVPKGAQRKLTAQKSFIKKYNANTTEI